jgi:DNA-binding transcriptional LysR family regulator
MEHRQLLHFLAACEEKSFSGAAQRCNISHQGLSLSIRQLEEQLDVPLFSRTAQGIEVTEFGRTLQRAVNAYINHHDQIISEMREMKQKIASRVSIALADGFSDTFPRNFFKDFILEHPDIDLTITNFPSDVCQNAMAEQNISLGFVDGPLTAGRFDSLNCNRHKVYLVAGQTHRLACRPSVKLAELRAEKLVFLNNNMYPQRLIMELCVREDVKFSFLLGGSDFNLITELCSTGRIVAFAAGPIDTTPGFISIPVDDFDAIYWEFHFIANRSVHLTEAAHAFIAYTREKVFAEKESG